MRRTYVLALLGSFSLMACREPSSAPVPPASPIAIDGTPVTIAATRSGMRRLEAVQRAFQIPGATKLSPTNALVRASEIVELRAAGEHAVVAIAPGAGVGVTVEIPLESDGALRVESSGITVAAKPLGLSRQAAELATQVAIYPGVSSDVDLYRRVDHDRVEDFYHVGKPHDRLTFSYDVSLAGVAGLRMVGGSLELLDAGGAPRLATNAPVVFDSKGVSRTGTISVRGCAYDTDPSGPWGRPVTAPGNDHCEVSFEVDTRGLSFPVLVDPAWFPAGNHYGNHAFHKLFMLPAGKDVGKILAVGGEGSSPTQPELYDVATGTWTKTPIGQLLPAGLGEGMNGVVFSDGRVVIAGGYAPGSSPSSGTVPASATTYVRDPLTGVWTPGPAMSSGRAHFAMEKVKIGGKEVALVAGGYASSSSSAKALKSAEYYDPIADTWVTTGTMSAERAYVGYTLLTNGKLLVTGGETHSGSFSTTTQSSTEQYDPATTKWTSAGSLIKARSSHTVTALPGGKALVAGGYNSTDGSELSSIEYWNGTTWSAVTAKLTENRKFAVSELLSDGRVLVAGGQFYDIGDVVTGSTNLISLGATPPGTITVVGSATMKPRANAASISLGAKVLVTGGVTDPSSGAATTASEIFDSTIGKACVTTASCPTGNFCTDGVCCKTASCGVGETCAAPGFEGVCTKPKGAACTSSSECGTGFCVTGVCCESACTATCMVCNIAPKIGTCAQAKAGTDPKNDCTGDPTCGPTCDSSGFCFQYAPTGTKCGAALSDGGSGAFCSTNACDSFGTCTTATNNCGLTCTTSVTCDEPTKTCKADATGIKPGFCVIDGTCQAYGDINPKDKCQLCDPPSSKTAWSISPSCTDGAVVDTGTDDTGSMDSGSFDDTGTVDTGTLVDTGAVADTGALADTGSADDASTAEVGTTPADLPAQSACSCDVPGNTGSPLAAVGIAGLLAVVTTRRRRGAQRAR